MTLPAGLIAAIAAPGGGRVALVIGAGTSVEPPTNLPASPKCAADAYKALLEQAILSDGACDDSEDLAKVADAVEAVTGSQEALVRALPIDMFLTASPNSGHLLAAAMLREQAVSAVVTLNFDLAMTTALGLVDAKDEVSIIAGPEDHARLGLTSLIYLHRNAYAPHNQWILSTRTLEEAWRNHWIEAIAARVLTGPVTVFAGVGTRVTALVESARRLGQMIASGREVYNVDPALPDVSEFFQALKLPLDTYLQFEWCEFMERLAVVVMSRHMSELEDACRQRCADEGWEHGDLPALCGQLGAFGLVGAGRIRARWLLRSSTYLPRRGNDPAHLADIILGVDVIERATGKYAVFRDNGLVDFAHEGHIVASIVVASGEGLRLPMALEAHIRTRERHWKRHYPRPHHALLAGVEGQEPEDAAAPESITFEEEADSIVVGPARFRVVTLRRLRINPGLAEGMVA